MSGPLDGVYAPDALPERLSGYDLLSCLKHTEEARVYLLEREGAKYILKGACGVQAAALEEEGALLRGLELPFLPRAVDAFEEGGTAWLLRTYVEGETLERLVERRGPLGPEEAARTALGVCALLGELHRLDPPVIHRDVKPQNVVATPEGGFALIDLGTARRWRPGAETDTVCIGTRATAAPEQFGYAQTDARSDVYGVGMLLTYLLTGDYDREAPALGALPPRLERVVRRCTAFDPGRRYPDMGALERALRGAGRKSTRLPALLLAFAVGLTAGFGLGRALPPPEPEGVVFTEPLIGEAVRRELGKAPGEPVLAEELEKVTRLLICGDRIFDDWESHRQYYQEHYLDEERVEGDGTISSLEDLRGMSSLTDLVLDDQNIRDLGPLEGLPLLRVSLCGSPVTDLSPLAGCASLTYLSVESTNVSDLAPLSGLRGLRTLDAGFTYVADLAPLEGLSLTTARFIQSQAADFGVLADMPLRELALSGADASVEDIGGIATLRELTLYESGLESLAPLRGLTELTSLDLYDNHLTSLEGVEVFTDLTRLCLGGNPVEDLSPLSALPGLERLEIQSTAVRDFSLLGELPALRYVAVSPERLESVRAAWPEADFDIVSE